MLVYLEPLSIFPDLHSDTLFGAITFAISELYSNEMVEKMLKEFEKEPPFLLSSPFPYAFNDDLKIRFFPKAMFQSNLDVEFSPQDFKSYKKIQYLEEDLFFKLVNGEISESDIISSLSDYKKVKNLLMTNDYGFDIGFAENILPNNSIDRLTNETDIFYTSGKQFKNLGLFFIVSQSK